jgi:hypothetical protein
MSNLRALGALLAAGVTALAVAAPYQQAAASPSASPQDHHVTIHKAYLKLLSKETNEPRTDFEADGSTTSVAAAGTNMTYHGGPVQHTAKLYLLFWGPNWTSTRPEYAYYQHFVSGLGVQPKDDWSTTMSQYTDSTGHPTFSGSVLKGTFIDSSTPPHGVTQTQLGAEADAFYKNNALTDTLNTQIVILTDTGVCPANFYGCGGSYCAWHSYSSAHQVPYTNMPYLNDAGSGCGEGDVNSPGTYDGYSIVGGHEYAETVTDPRINAWFYVDSGGENGDLCAWTNTANVVLSTGTFAMQPTWSNKISGCAMHTPITTTTVTTVDDASASVAYTGTWSRISNTAFLKGTEHVSTAASSTASLTFTGTKVTYLASKTTAAGSVDIYLDGVLKATKSLASTSTVNKATIYASPLLTAGSHTIKLVVKSGRVNVDAFKVTS